MFRAGSIALTLVLSLGCGKQSETTTVSSTVPQEASASASMSPAPPLPPYGFELGKAVINPRVGDKAVILGDDGACFTFGPVEPGPRAKFIHQRITCPDGAQAKLGDCRGGIVRSRDGSCTCMLPEGGRPAPTRPIHCPK